MSSFSIFLILILVVSFLLVLVIMVQNPKGGGLSSSFGGGDSQQIGGVRKTTDFLESITSAVTSIPRYAGKQCVKIAFFFANQANLSLHTVHQLIK